MKATGERVTRVGGLLLIAALALTGVAAPASATGQGAAGTCGLTIQRVPGPDLYQVDVSCTDAQVLNFTLMGSDPWPNPDDRLVRILGSSKVIGGDFLNEDIGARDEVYAKVSYQIPGGSSGSRNSNTVTGRFGSLFT